MRKLPVSAVLLTLLALQIFSGCFSVSSVSAQTPPSVYVGIDIAYGSVAEAETEIDKVSAYTNLVVFGSTDISWYQDRFNETFQYAYDKGLSIISLRPSLMQYNAEGLNETAWYAMAETQWGNRLLGFYIMDEPGGRQIDGTQQGAWNNYTGLPSSYSQAATMFTEGIGRSVSSQRPNVNYPYKAFTSDYALYWYDYKAGYDAVWTELGGNYSKQIAVALCRGAAASQNKDWGAIITWKYNQYPWIESPSDLYNDMLLAYNNGAKYIVVFDSNEQGGSILTEGHFDAMQRFWSYIQTNQPQASPKSERAAYVLPDAYGFGFRWPTDHIWGIWQADELSTNITKSVGALLTQYGEKLDIIYDDGSIAGNNGYSQLIYWNNYDPTPTATPTPPPTETQTVSPTPTAEVPIESSFPTTVAIVAAAVAFAAIGSALLLLHFKKQKLKP